MISRHNFSYIPSDIWIIPISHNSQLLHLPQELIRIKRNRLPNMNQIIIRLRQPLLSHQLLFIKLLPRSKSSSCQDRNNFFLKKICNTMNYRITHKNGAKKELLFSQKPFHINYLLFYYFLKNLPIQQIILFSYTFKNQFLGSHIKFYRLYSLIRIIT